MQYLLYVCCFTLVLSLGLAAPVEAKDGKGQGGGPTLASQQGGQQETLSKEEQKLLKEHEKEQVSVLKRQEKLVKQQEKEQQKHLKEQEKLLKEQRQLDHKLAQAQYLRQLAQRTGNQQLLAEADRMEAQAREHYAQQLLKLADDGMIDPTANPGGMTPTLPGGMTPTVPGRVTYPVYPGAATYPVYPNGFQPPPSRTPAADVLGRIERLFRP
jgi:hypothetical protein